MLSHLAVLLLSRREQCLLIGAREHSASSPDIGLNALAATNPVMPSQPLSVDEFGPPNRLSALVGEPPRAQRTAACVHFPDSARPWYLGRIIQA
jgi:hypothetical protein